MSFEFFVAQFGVLVDLGTVSIGIDVRGGWVHLGLSFVVGHGKNQLLC